MSMKWALYFDGELVKKTAALPTIDQSIPIMQAGYEWREIVEDPTPDSDPVYQRVKVSERKTAGAKLRVTKAVEDNPDWQAAARAAVNSKLSGYLRLTDDILREVITGVVGPHTTRSRAAVAQADALIAQIEAGQKPDLNAGWPA